MSGLVIGTALASLIYGFALLNVDAYISFMNMDVAIYRTFVIYSIISLLLQTIFSFILDKLYYENQNNKANRYSIIFNLLNFSVLIGTALITKNQTIIITVTSAVILIFTTFIVLKNCNKFHLRLNLAL